MPHIFNGDGAEDMYIYRMSTCTLSLHLVRESLVLSYTVAEGRKEHISPDLYYYLAIHIPYLV